MPEKFRIQAQQDGKWKTQSVFEEGAKLSDVREQAERFFVSEKFGDVRILERVFDAAKDKSSYRLRWTNTPKPQPEQNAFEDNKPATPIWLKTKKGLTGDWVYISKQQASYHPLYGVGGWLAYLTFSLIVSCLVEILESGLFGPLLEIETFVNFIVIGLFYSLLFFLLLKKKPAFQWVAFLFLTLSFLMAFLGAVDVSPQNWVKSFINIIWCIYLLVSKRVNVTYKNRVRRGDIRLVLGPGQIDHVRYVKKLPEA